MRIFLSLVFLLALSGNAQRLFGSLGWSESRFPFAEPAFSEQMVASVNVLRQSGCRCGRKWMSPAPPLRWNHQLEAAALKHAQDMERNDFFSHQGSDRSHISNRADEAGYDWSALGENIAEGYHSLEKAVEAWKESPEHCRQMMDPAFQEMGAARAGTFWVQTFGRPTAQ